MKGRSILLDEIQGREAAALMVDGQLDDLLIDTDAPRPGTVYRAKVARPVKGQGGVFLETPDGNAFLRQAKGLAQGTHLLVQVTGYAEAGKAIPVTTKLLFKSRFAIVTPEAPGLNVSRAIKDDSERDRLLETAHEIMGNIEMGLIVRSAAEGRAEAEIGDDIAAMRDLANAVMQDADTGLDTLVEGDGPHALAWRDWTDPADVRATAGCFEADGVLDAIDAARGSKVSLADGASMYVELTRALVAVDVNTGGSGALAAGLKANLACARALPRALRVRGFGGQITIDLAPAPKKDRRLFEDALRRAFRADDIETTLAGWSPLGHFELQRKRARVPIHEVLT